MIKNQQFRAYIYQLLLYLYDLDHRPKCQSTELFLAASIGVSSRFKHLVEKNFTRFREVKKYADMLYVTPKHLSEVVKTNTGKSPREIINDMLLLESKVLLGSTDKTITEIAHELQFQDQSHFSHFIKQHAGCSPMQLRKKL